MLLLFIRLSSLPRPKREPNKRPNPPPFRKPDGGQEQTSVAHIHQKKTIEAICKTRQVYHLERRSFY